LENDVGKRCWKTALENGIRKHCRKTENSFGKWLGKWRQETALEN
jgi:hypothetical protein